MALDIESGMIYLSQWRQEKQIDWLHPPESPIDVWVLDCADYDSLQSYKLRMKINN